MIDVCRQDKIRLPKFEELGQFFRVTLYPRTTSPIPSVHWHIPIIEYLRESEQISAKTAQQLWKISRRSATNRLKEMCEHGILVELSTGPRDPYKVFVLSEHGK
jgi:Fic family protein